MCQLKMTCMSLIEIRQEKLNVKLNMDRLTVKGELTRQALLDAASLIAGRDGVPAVNVMNVCKQAGVGRTSFYNYFDDVHQLISEIARQVSADVQMQFETFHGEMPRGIERLHACLKFVLEFGYQQGDQAKLVTSLSMANPKPGDLVRQRIVLELEGAVSAGEIPMPSAGIISSANFLTTILLVLMREFASGERNATDIATYCHYMIAAVGGDSERLGQIQG